MFRIAFNGNIIGSVVLCLIIIVSIFSCTKKGEVKTSQLVVECISHGQEVFGRRDKGVPLATIEKETVHHSGSNYGTVIQKLDKSIYVIDTSSLSDSAAERKIAELCQNYSNTAVVEVAPTTY